MTMRYLTIIGILLIIISSCDITGDDLKSFINKNPKELNDRITKAKLNGESWTNDPLLIVRELFHSEDFERKTIIDIESQSNNKVTITLTEELLGDDSVYGEKRIIEFKKDHDLWTILSLRLGFKCQEHRGGHTNYSGYSCS
jgi:hypothetical protein